LKMMILKKLRIILTITKKKEPPILMI